MEDSLGSVCRLPTPLPPFAYIIGSIQFKTFEIHEEHQFDPKKGKRGSNIPQTRFSTVFLVGSQNRELVIIILFGFGVIATLQFFPQRLPHHNG